LLDTSKKVWTPYDKLIFGITENTRKNGENKLNLTKKEKDEREKTKNLVR
jgi:hypothetical protein